MKLIKANRKAWDNYLTSDEGSRLKCAENITSQPG